MVIFVRNVLTFNAYCLPENQWITSEVNFFVNGQLTVHLTQQIRRYLNISHPVYRVSNPHPFHANQDQDPAQNLNRTGKKLRPPIRIRIKNADPDPNKKHCRLLITCPCCVNVFFLFSAFLDLFSLYLVLSHMLENTAPNSLRSDIFHVNWRKKNMKKGKRMKKVEAANKKKKEEGKFKLEGYRYL